MATAIIIILFGLLAIAKNEIITMSILLIGGIYLVAKLFEVAPHD